MGFLAPTIGNWYQDENEGKLFEVVAIDEKNGTIEVQYDDGNISEYDLESWGLTPISAAVPPEDANAAFEAGFEEEWGDEAHQFESGFSNPLDNIEPDIFTGFDDLY